MQRITPCLWFDGRAVEAMNFYVSIFKNAKPDETMDYSEGGPGKPGSVMSVTFELDGQTFMGLNGGPMFQFTPAFSMFVRCESQEEVDYYWDRLGQGGAPQRCGWLTDKFGISWQVNPIRLSEMLEDPDKQKTELVMKALLQMKKLDLATLEKAFNGHWFLV